MPLVRFDAGPKIGDDILIEIDTTDADGNPWTPYKVNTVTIYYLERGVASGGTTQEFTDGDLTISFSNAVPVKVFGDAGNPAWFSEDPAESLLTQITEDEEGNPIAGRFQVVWYPEFIREGDYFICFTWEPIIAASTLSDYLRFYLKSNTTLTTTMPLHATKPGKYEKLMDRYLPEMFKNVLSNDDVTPDVLSRLNLAVAGAFTDLEDRANQILSLQDANALTDALLPYLANLFSWKLKTQDSRLHRRQIKRAIPVYKQKGTLKGLKEALEESGMSLTSIKQYWQVASTSTYQEAFRVAADGEEAFKLTKVPLAVDLLNFELSILPAGTTTYAPLTSSDVTFTVTDGVGYMNWVGSFELEKDDILKVLYKVAPVANQSIENYIRSLPLMDTRSEIVMRDLDFCYPKKNWNIRLIAEDDAMFPLICPTRHPYHPDVIFGKIRTEFPYSENIYNMDEYNGSTRDSLLPCDIDRDFLDACPCCLSSSLSLDVELQNLSNDRMSECQEILRDFLPFHARLYSVNFNGSQEEFLLPPVEEISTYMTSIINDKVIHGQLVVNRSIQPWIENKKREMLAAASTVATASNGVGFNQAISLYYGAENFDNYTMGLDVSNNILEILSGLNTGSYSITNPNDHLADFTNPALLPQPFDQTKFPFRLSNVRYTGGGDIFQDDKFIFSDATVNFSKFNIRVKKTDPTWWKITVVSGPQAGTYDIYDVLPDGTLVILGWPTTTTVNNINYQLVSDGSFIAATSTAGKVTVERRGRFESTADLIDQYHIKVGHYLQLSGQQYKIIGFLNDSDFYVSGYTSGTQVGIPSIKILKRLVDNGIGQLAVRGMRLETTTNYYSTLGVSSVLDNNQHMQNFTVLISSKYYQIASWSSTANGSGRYEIVLNGQPVLNWGATTGTSSISFSIVKFDKTSPVDVTVTFPQFATHSITKVDRRGEEVFGTVQVSGMPPSLVAEYLNSVDDTQPFEVITQGESITYTIETQS